jgi:hypothetical protein
MLWQLPDGIWRRAEYVSAKLCLCVSTEDIQTWSKDRFVINFLNTFILFVFVFLTKFRRSHTKNTGSYKKNATILNYCNYVSSTE